MSFRLFKTARCPENCAGALNAPMPTPGELERTVSRLRRTFHVQAAFTALFFVAFLLYIPVGLAIIAPFKRLTIAECLERDLGDDYCTVTMKYDSVQTKLWNYGECARIASVLRTQLLTHSLRAEDDFTATQIRAAAQLGCILTLVGYSISFMTHDYSGGKASPRPSTTEENASVGFTAIAMLTSPEVESGEARGMAVP